MATLAPEYRSSPWLDPGKWEGKWPVGKQRAIATSVRNDEVRPGLVKAMVKREIYHNVPSRARLIQFYSNLATQALFGPQFYALQDVVAHEFRDRIIGHGIDVTIACGMNADDLGAWMDRVMERNPYGFYERDGKNWDSTMTQVHAEFKRSLYSIFDPELADFVAACETVKGGAAIKDCYYRYTMAFTVKSGHNDTTLGNSLINAAIVIEALISLTLRGSILVMGDDVLVAIYDSFDSERIVEIEKGFGIQPEARVRGGGFKDPERVTFISGCWMYDGAYRFCPIPGRLIARTWWTVNNPGSGAKLDAYRRAVSLGLLASCRNMPVIRVFLNKFLPSSSRVGRSDKGYVYRTSANGLVDGMAAFCKRYEVTEAQVAECEQWLEGIVAEPLILRHPLLSRMVEVDGEEIDDRLDSASLGEH